MLDPAANATVISYLDTLAGAEAVDEHTVDILTKGPDPILARRMSFAMIGPAEVLAKAPDSLADKPIGTGPYKLTEWVKGSKISMTANEEYWGPTKPTIKDVEFQPRKESSVRLTAIKAGEAHLAEYITPEDAGTLPREQVLSGLSVECMQLRPNTKAGITADLRVRQAISHSIDRENLTKSIYGPYAELPNGQLYAKTSFAYDPNMRDVPFDLDKAKSLVKEAGAEGKEVSIVGIASDRFVKGREVQEAVAAMIGKTGLVVNLKLVESADWIKSLYEIQNPPMDIWFGSAGNEMQDGDRIFGSYIKTGGRAALYSNPEVDQWIDASRAELDTAKRAALIQQIARKIQTDVALIPLVQLQNIYGISPKLKFEIYPSAIAPAARMQLSG
jgi:peptide/nickel transport system substrate-binding protein